MPRVIEMWDQLLDRGHKLGVVGGSDDHRAGMGTGVTASPIGSPTTLVLADRLSEAAIVDAVSPDALSSSSAAPMIRSST